METGKPDPSKVREYLKALLEYYDFDVREEYFVSPNEKIDLYGHSRAHEKTIGVKITFAGDVREDAERLAGMNFDLAFVVVDNPIYEGKTEYRERTVSVVHYDNFEGELRRVLRISSSYPTFGGFDGWSKKHVEYPVGLARSDKGRLESFLRVLEDAGLTNCAKESSARLRHSISPKSFRPWRGARSRTT